MKKTSKKQKREKIRGSRKNNNKTIEINVGFAILKVLIFVLLLSLITVKTVDIIKGKVENKDSETSTASSYDYVNIELYQLYPWETVDEATLITSGTFTTSSSLSTICDSSYTYLSWTCTEFSTEPIGQGQRFEIDSQYTIEEYLSVATGDTLVLYTAYKRSVSSRDAYIKVTCEWNENEYELTESLSKAGTCEFSIQYGWIDDAIMYEGFSEEEYGLTYYDCEVVTDKEIETFFYRTIGDVVITAYCRYYLE